MIKRIYFGFHVKYPVFLSDFNETSIFLTVFRKNTQISNFMTIRLVGAELLNADSRTDIQDDDNSPCGQFCGSA